MTAVMRRCAVLVLSMLLAVSVAPALAADPAVAVFEIKEESAASQPAIALLGRCVMLTVAGARAAAPSLVCVVLDADRKPLFLETGDATAPGAGEAPSKARLEQVLGALWKAEPRKGAKPFEPAAEFLYSGHAPAGAMPVSLAAKKRTIDPAGAAELYRDIAQRVVPGTVPASAGPDPAAPGTAKPLDDPQAKLEELSQRNARLEVQIQHSNEVELAWNRHNEELRKLTPVRQWLGEHGDVDPVDVAAFLDTYSLAVYKRYLPASDWEMLLLALGAMLVTIAAGAALNEWARLKLRPATGLGRAAAPGNPFDRAVAQRLEAIAAAVQRAPEKLQYEPPVPIPGRHEQATGQSAQVSKLLEEIQGLRNRYEYCRTLMTQLGDAGAHMAQAVAGRDNRIAMATAESIKASLDVLNHLRRNGLLGPPPRHSVEFIDGLWACIRRYVPEAQPGDVRSLERFSAAMEDIRQAVRNSGGNPPNELDGIARAVRDTSGKAQEKARQGEAASQRLQAWQTELRAAFGAEPSENSTQQFAEWARSVRQVNAYREQAEEHAKARQQAEAAADDAWQLGRMVIQWMGYEAPQRSEIALLRHRLETQDRDLLALRSAGVAALARLRTGVDELHKAGRQDVLELLKLPSMEEYCRAFLRSIEQFEDAATVDPLAFWERAMFSRLRSWLHPLLRAETVLDGYFADHPAFDAARSAVALMAELVRYAAFKADARVCSAAVLAAPPEGAERMYATSREVRDIAEIRRQALARERLGGEFVVDLHEAGFYGPHGNTRLTVVLYNPAAWA